MMEYERQGDDQIRAAFALGGEAEYYQPKDPGPECLWCDGGGTVDVASITDVGGKQHQLKDYFPFHNPTMTCLRCDGTGVEPRPEPEDR